MNMERGDTFIVDEDKFRGAHFTCTGTREHSGDSYFYAGDTAGRMFRFKSWKDNEYQVYETRNVYRGTISAEAIIQE